MNKKVLTVNVLFNVMVMLILISQFIPSGNSNENVCHAYLDPGTGSMIISAIVGIFATIALGVKTFWYKIVRIFNPSKKLPETKKSQSSKK